MKENILTQYTARLAVLRQSVNQDTGNVFIAHGIMLLFCQQFEFAKQLLRAALIESGHPLAASDSTRELIMDAYEEYLFIDDVLWVTMAADRRRIWAGEGDDVVLERILNDYIPAFAMLEKEMKNDKKSH